MRNRNVKVLVLILALAVPLVMYTVPYAYASATSSSYIVTADNVSGDYVVAHCNLGDYETGGGGDGFGFTPITISEAVLYDFTTGTYSLTSSGTANAWIVRAPSAPGVEAQVTCQSPITVAGITVPEFGSLYVAIALGALVYFLMARQFQRRPITSGRIQA